MTRPHRILVTGAGGQLGYALVNAAGSEPAAEVDAGVEVIGMARADLDIADDDAVARVLDSVQPAAVVNAAAMTRVDDAEDAPEQTHAANALGPGHLARRCAAAGVPLLHVSTDYVFDGTKGSPYVETDPTNPLGVYAASKVAGEQAVLEAPGKALVLRTSWVFSGRAHGFVRAIVQRARTHPEMAVVAAQVSNPTPAAALASQLLALATRAASGESLRWGLYHLAGTAPASRWEWAEALITALRKREDIPLRSVEAVTADAWPARARRPQYTAMDTALARNTFELAAIDWREYIDETVAEIIAANPIDSPPPAT